MITIRNLSLYCFTLIASGLSSTSCSLFQDTAASSTDSPEIPSAIDAVPLPGDPPPAVDTIWPGVSGNLTLGTATTLIIGYATSTGGIITVDKPGDPLNGMSLILPNGAVSSPTTFTISSTPIVSSSFGPFVTPVSPLITIDNGGVFTNEILTLKIPTAVLDGQFALAVYYDEASSTLEPLPVIAEDNSSITVATRHFSSIFVTAANSSLLLDILDSGFRPGNDDWQFSNYGSYVSKGGHCAGQSISSVWYYLNQYKTGLGSSLYGLFDNDGGTKTPNLWQDDSLGYRFASTIQEDIDWKGFAYKLFTNFSDVSQSVQWNAFRYALALTGEPQVIGLYDKGKTSGHAMIVYRSSNNQLFVADPNYPARLRTIVWNEGSSTFDTYNSGDNAADIAQGDQVIFDKFWFLGQTAVIDWNLIANRFLEFRAGTIGDDRFPNFGLEVSDGTNNGAWMPLADGFSTDRAEVKVRLVPPNNDDWMVVAYNGEYELGVERNEPLTIPLNPGPNDLGIAIWGSKREWDSYEYVNFEHIAVTRSDAPPDATDENCSFNLTFPGTLPSFTPTAAKASYVNLSGVTSVELSFDTGAFDPSLVATIVTMGGGISAPGTFGVGNPSGTCAPACGTYTINSAMYESVPQSADMTASSITITEFGMNVGERIVGSFSFYLSPNLFESTTFGPLEGNFSCLITE
jgi:hypothetical protein